MITVNARKPDGSVGKSWTAKLIRQSGELLVLEGKFERRISHGLLGIIECGTRSVEYYWLDRWYNVFLFFNPDGTFRNYYCNINQPPSFNDGTLDYVDLDIDLVVHQDRSYDVLDEQEFEESSVRYGFSDELRSRVANAVKELMELIERRQFPFDGATIPLSDATERQ